LICLSQMKMHTQGDIDLLIRQSKRKCHWYQKVSSRLYSSQDGYSYDILFASAWHVSFLHARSEIVHSFYSYSSMYFTRHTLCIMHSITDVVYPGKPSFDWIICISQWQPLLVFGLSCPNWSQSLIFLIFFVNHLFSGVNSIKISNFLERSHLIFN
jgi:hypothetical protein